MKIFYSWQSDTENSSNRNFIESVIKKTIKRLNKHDLSYEMNLDRDTKGELGTPDILDTILSKIEDSYFFIGDITFINPKTFFSRNSKKTPNPNVLFELGYASKAIGWHKTICFFNSDYGKVDDLPFDLRLRRPLIYSLENKDKASVRNDLVGILETNLKESISNYPPYEVINIEFKKQIDLSIYKILTDLSKLINTEYENSFGYPTIISLLEKPLTAQIEKLLKRKFLGFFIHKNWSSEEKDIKELLDNSLYSNDLSREVIRSIHDIIWALRGMNRYHNSMTFSETDSSNNYSLELKSKEKETVFYELNKSCEHGNLILKDQGEFFKGINEEHLLKQFEFNTNCLDCTFDQITTLINGMKKWLKLFGGKFYLGDGFTIIKLNHE